jgi:hypothetical protein
MHLCKPEVFRPSQGFNILIGKYLKWYELNCQVQIKFYKFISKQRIISLEHISILRQIWLNFVVLCFWLFPHFTILTIRRISEMFALSHRWSYCIYCI